jgi:PPOX class probable F420-dependent enzyme
VVFDSESKADLHARARLGSEMVGWLTTVTAEGQPQTFPIWFLWQDGTLLIYSDRRAKRNANIAANPRVSFHLDATPKGGDVLVIEGTARIDQDAPDPAANAAYLARYGPWITESFGDVATFEATYNVAVRITPDRGRASA